MNREIGVRMKDGWEMRSEWGTVRAGAGGMEKKHCPDHLALYLYGKRMVCPAGAYLQGRRSVGDLGLAENPGEHFCGGPEGLHKSCG